MPEKKRRPAKKRTGTTTASKSPYFMQPARQGSVTVFRRAAGNRIDATLCGTMPSRALALALVKQLEKAESVVHDLFLEATDDGIEALEAVLEACRVSVSRRAEQAQQRPASGAGPGPGARRRGRGRRRLPPGTPGTAGGPSARGPRDEPPSADTLGAAPSASAEDTSAA